MVEVLIGSTWDKICQGCAHESIGKKLGTKSKEILVVADGGEEILTDAHILVQYIILQADWWL